MDSPTWSNFTNIRSLDQYLRGRFNVPKMVMLFSVVFVVALFSHYTAEYITSDSKVYYQSLKNLVGYGNVKSLEDKSQSPSTCLLIIRSADGALGNRMFLFASAYGLARLHQCDLYIGPWIIYDLRSVFRIELNETLVHLVTNDSVVVNRTDIYGRYSACTLYEDLFRVPFNQTFRNYEMVGFYQAYGYFEKYRDEINFLFQFNSATISLLVPFVESLLKVIKLISIRINQLHRLFSDPKCLVCYVLAVWNIPLNMSSYTKETVPHKYLKSLLIHPPHSKKPITWIGIHIRRGDFLSFFKIDTSVEYLNWAMNYYRRKYINCRFIIASDDKKYVETNLGHNQDIFITPKNFFSGHDMAALALCEHTIVTAGTYGWWAGWLAGGDVVHDLNYPVPFQNCVKEHYFPPWFVFPHNSSSQRWKVNP